MDKETGPARETPSAGDEAARIASLLFGEESDEPDPPGEAPSSRASDDDSPFLFGDESDEPDPPREAPSALASDDDASFLVVDEAGVTRPASETPSSYAARMFGEEAAGNYGVMGRLMIIDRLPVGGLGLLTIGFRITDRPGEKWTRRFNRFKRGEPAATKAAIRTFCAAFEDFLPLGTRASSSSPRSRLGRILCNTTRRRRYWRPRLRDPAAGSGFRITSPRTGIPVSPASPPRPSATPPWTGCICLPPSEAIPAS